MSKLLSCFDTFELPGFQRKHQGPSFFSLNGPRQVQKCCLSLWWKKSTHNGGEKLIPKTNCNYSSQFCHLWPITKRNPRESINTKGSNFQFLFLKNRNIFSQNYQITKKTIWKVFHWKYIAKHSNSQKQLFGVFVFKQMKIIHNF